MYAWQRGLTVLRWLHLETSCPERDRGTYEKILWGRAQSIQSARLFLQPSELEPPPPHPQVSLSPLLVQRGGHTPLREKGGGSQFRRGNRHCGYLGMYVLCGDDPWISLYRFFLHRLSKVPLHYTVWSNASVHGEAH
jgi:hypothetical protein